MTSDVLLCKKCEEYWPIEEFKYGKSNCYTCQTQMSREWKARNKERTTAYTQTWKRQHQEYVSAYNSAYFAENREVIQARSSKYHVDRAKRDPNFKMAKNLRNRFRKVLKCDRLGESSLSILGCSIEFFKRWLEYKFESDMTFENHGTVWDLDHVIPISKFELHDNEDEVRKCFHWTNFQPLYHSANLKKSCSVTKEEVDEHIQSLHAFLQDLSEDDRGQYSIIDIDRVSYVNKKLNTRSNRGATKVLQE